MKPAIKEFDRLGPDEFLRLYGFGTAKKYFITLSGRRYDSKAIMGYAHGLHPGPRLTSRDFTGGEQTVVRQLELLGFEVDIVRPNTTGAPSWDIEHGAELLRQDVHRRLGGTTQGGIAPLRNSPNILLFSSSSGRLFGYDAREGWLDPDTYLYTGEGQTGDQRFTRGNAAVRDHRETGRALRLFEEAGRTRTTALIVRYVGEFTLDRATPFERHDAPDGRLDEMRSVIVFRLRPTVEVSRPALPPASSRTVVTRLTIESHEKETFTSNPAVGLTESERREAALVKRYSKWLEKRGRGVGRQQIRLPAGTSSLYTDLYDFTTDELVEAKGMSSRNHVRLAIGQLLDYGRYIDHASKSVLLPVRPEQDLIDLMKDLDICCIYELEDGGFARTDQLA